MTTKKDILIGLAFVVAIVCAGPTVLMGVDTAIHVVDTGTIGKSFRVLRVEVLEDHSVSFQVQRSMPREPWETVKTFYVLTSIPEDEIRAYAIDYMNELVAANGVVKRTEVIKQIAP